MSGQKLTPVLAITVIRERLALLQQAVDRPEHAELRPLLADLNALCRTIQRTVSDGVYQLAKTDDGLKGLLDLLEKSGSTRVVAHRLASLMAPLQQQLHGTRDDIGQLL